MDASGLPVPDAIYPLLQQLQELLTLEIKFQPDLQLPSITQNDNELTLGVRDGSTHVLRCLKMWYDMPSDVFFNAINLMDRFLTKMKVRPKHMACISVASFHIAAIQMAHQMDPDHLVSISQCKCTGGDLKRMSDVIRNKLDWAPGTQPVTSLNFLRLFNMIFHTVSVDFGIEDLYTNIVTEYQLPLRLEMVACDGNCASLRACEIALVLLCIYLDVALKRLNDNSNSTESNDHSNKAQGIIKLIGFAAELQKICKISDESFYSTYEAVSHVMTIYNKEAQLPYKQRLVWRLSSRTARLLRPTDKFTSVLPVIAEHAPIPSPSRIRKNRKFTRRCGNKRR